MCGRFARYQPLSAWLDPLEITPETELFARLGAQSPRYNIVPGTKTWIAIGDADGTPSVAEQTWAFPTRRGNRINVRSETAHRVPEYREHFDRQRCVVFANGFYEPKGPKTMKNRPWYFFRPGDESPLFLAAIVKAEGFSILTGVPAGPVAAIHDRSPMMIPSANVRAWLDPDLSGRNALEQCAPASLGESLESWHVGDGAKNPMNEGPDLIAQTRPPQRSLF